MRSQTMDITFLPTRLYPVTARTNTSGIITDKIDCPLVTTAIDSSINRAKAMICMNGSNEVIRVSTIVNNVQTGAQL